MRFEDHGSGIRLQFHEAVQEQVEIEVKYEGYIKREKRLSRGEASAAAAGDEPQIASREDLEGYGFASDEEEAEPEAEKG